MSLLMVSSLFVLCALVIVASGTWLSYYGDVIAERSGLGQAWVGVIAMASVKSLPELVTGVSAAVINAPEIALGDIVGSCLFNLLILGVLDVMTPTPLLNRLRQVHTLSAALGGVQSPCARRVVNSFPHFQFPQIPIDQPQQNLSRTVAPVCFM